MSQRTSPRKKITFDINDDNVVLRVERSQSVRYAEVLGRGFDASGLPCRIYLDRPIHAGLADAYDWPTDWIHESGFASVLRRHGATKEVRFEPCMPKATANLTLSETAASSATSAPTT